MVNLEIRDVSSHSRPAKRIVINGSMNGVELCYAATFVEGKEHFYQIITMSKMEDEEKYDPMMMGIVESFKEL